MYVQVSKFEPIRISPNAFLTRHGVQDGNGRDFAIYTVSDVKNMLRVLQTHIVAAIGGLLPLNDSRGREPWAFVNEQLFLYVQSANAQSAHAIMVDVAPYLMISRKMIGYKTQDDDQRALCAFVDLYLDAALGMSKDQILESRGQAAVSIESLLDDEPSSLQRWKNPISQLPWPGDLGANIGPLDDFSTAHGLFHFFDLAVIGNNVWAAMGSSPMPIPMEIRLSEAGSASLRKFLQRCRAAEHLDEGIDQGDSIGGKCSVASDGHDLAACHNDVRYRISTYPAKTGERYWSLRYIPMS